MAGLREIKKARSKIALYEASLDLIGRSSFRDVLLEDICAQAEVSKVTFFKFFPKKEDVLVYFMCVWLLERMLEIEETGWKGAAGVRHILHSVAEGAKQRPGLMLSLIAFLAESKMHPCMPELTEAEYVLLFPDREKRAMAMDVNMFALFHRLIDEAKAAGECTRTTATPELVQWLLSVFYGAFLTAHLCRQDIGATYELHLQLILTEE